MSFSSPVLVAVLLVLGADVLYAQPAFRNVRVIDRDLRHALQRGCEESATLRRLVDEIEASDVIVHVLLTADLSAATAGALRWVTEAGGVRFLRIVVNDQLPPRVIPVVLAHELQHAVEVARAPSVRDAAAFARLYQHIGERRPHLCRRCYDTAAARRVQQRVADELTVSSR